MECPNCSASILEHAKVCPFCQTRFDNDSNQNEKELYDEKKINKKQKNKFNFKSKKKSSKKTNKPERKDFYTTQSLNEDKFDISYTINSSEQAQLIRDIVNNVSTENTYKNSSKSQVSKNRKKRRISNKTRRFIFFSVITVILCCLIFWGCSAIFNAINASKSDTEYITYLKNNSLNIAQRGISREISSALINIDSFKASQLSDEENKNTEKDDTNKPKETELPEIKIEELTSDKVIELVQQHNLVYKTENKRYLYFISEFDVTNNMGELKCYDLKKEKVIDIASNVNDSLIISDDGERLMFLQNTDFSGNAGTLTYKDINDKSVINIAEDIDKDMYTFSKNPDKILFLGNFDHSVEAGEFYEYDISVKESERVKIDSDVCKIFGTDKTGSIYIYAKDYNAGRGCYDIYTKENNKDRVKIIEESILPPIISSTSNEMYMYGGNVGPTHNLYLVNIKNNEKKKLASEISDIVKISKDEKSVLYRKVFSESSSDYYIYTKGNAEPYKVASDVRIIPEDNKFNGLSQISISDDFKSITYISGFDAEKGKGVLYKTSYNGKNASDGKKIADEAFLCRFSNDGKYIIYAKNYSVTRDVVDIYKFENSDSTLIKEEIGYNLFEISENGDNIICISNFNQEKEYGTLEQYFNNGESQKLLDDASAFYILSDDTVVMLNEYNNETKTFNIYISDRKNKALKSGENCTYIIL